MGLRAGCLSDCLTIRAGLSAGVFASVESAMAVEGAALASEAPETCPTRAVVTGNERLRNQSDITRSTMFGVIRSGAPPPWSAPPSCSMYGDPALQTRSMSNVRTVRADEEYFIYIY
jgi:hypothetical protein